MRQPFHVQPLGASLTKLAHRLAVNFQPFHHYQQLTTQFTMQFAQLSHYVLFSYALCLHAQADTDPPSSLLQAEAAYHSQPILAPRGLLHSSHAVLSHLLLFSCCKKKPYSSIKAMLS